ncbi:substrate-binding domain-containing protein [Maribacter litopenaei]|uniref:substrate-binding domain-containing protein n=1 Tax=Maribacter litopenaei TaxID=2976127 RepID=UPI003B84A4C3
MNHGIREAYEGLESFGMAIKPVQMGNTPEEYYRNFNAVLENNPDALVIVPFFTETCIDLYRKLEGMEIPFVLLNSPINSVNYSSFIGQDYVQSGRTAAYLMDILTKEIRDERKLLILNMDVQTENKTHVEEKEMGFLDYFKENHQSTKVEILSLEDVFDTDLLNSKISQVDGLFITNSKTHIAAPVIRNHPSVKIIGYDMIPENIELLNEGAIDILLNQNPETSRVSWYIDYL